MRWIFFTLVLLNGAYFGWEFWQQSHHVPVQGADTSTPLPPVEGKELELLTERLPSPGSSVPPPTIAPEKPASPAPVSDTSSASGTSQQKAEQLCSSVGPFNEEGKPGQLVEELAAAGVYSVLDSKVTEQETQYWVILPPAGDRHQALQTLKELQARKIDSYLISSGDMKNSISLGLFTREALAKGVQEKIREAGYPAEIRLKERSETEYWVRIRPGQPLENAKKVLNSYVAGDSGVKISNSPCEMFAQTR